MLDVTTYLPKLKEFEGVYSHMYLDTTDNVTVGAGQMLANVAAAQKLAFEVRPDPAPNLPVSARPATPDEIQADFDSVTRQPGGRTAGVRIQGWRPRRPDRRCADRAGAGTRHGGDAIYHQIWCAANLRRPNLRRPHLRWA